MTILTGLGKKLLENIEGKGENAGKQHFLLFPKDNSVLNTSIKAPHQCMTIKEKKNPINYLI